MTKADYTKLASYIHSCKPILSKTGDNFIHTLALNDWKSNVDFINTCLLATQANYDAKKFLILCNNRD